MPTMPDQPLFLYSDEELMHLLRRGEVRAMVALMRRHREDIRRLAGLYCGNDSVALDIAQDVCIRLFHSAGRYTRSLCFRPWLLRIAADTMLARRPVCCSEPVRGTISGRGDGGGPEGSGVGEFSAPPGALPWNTFVAGHLQQALCRVPPLLRLALIIGDIAGYSRTETAAAINCDVHTVFVYIDEGRQRFRSELAHLHAQAIAVN